MTVIRYADIYDTTQLEDGTIVETPIRSDFTMPIILNPYKIDTIEPYVTTNCKIFKNVSIITYDSGKQFKVVGNYIKLDEYKTKGKIIRNIGYGKTQ